MKLTEIKVVNPDGTLRTLDAGTVLEHEGYQGKVQITDAGGTRWVSQRTQTYEHQAKRTGDWEGTAEQEAHRHGGGNVAGSPTETTATAVTAFGPVLSKPNVITYSTVSEGSARLVSNSTSTNTTATNSTSRPADVRIVFVPTTQTSATKELQVVTGSMIESSQSLLFGAGANAGLGVLAAVGMGAVQSAQAAEQLPALVSDGVHASASTTPHVVSNSNTFISTPGGGSTNTSTSTVTFKQVDLGVFHVRSSMCKAQPPPRQHKTRLQPARCPLPQSRQAPLLSMQRFW